MESVFNEYHRYHHKDKEDMKQYNMTGYNVNRDRPNLRLSSFKPSFWIEREDRGNNILQKRNK